MAPLTLQTNELFYDNLPNHHDAMKGKTQDVSSLLKEFKRDMIMTTTDENEEGQEI